MKTPDELGQPFVFGTHYLKLPRDPQPWLIQDMIPIQGLVNCYARPKVGKSFLAIGISEAIGNPNVDSFLGFPVRKHGKVLYLQIDTPRSFWADRLEKIVATGDYDISNIGFADRLMAPKGFNILNIESKIWLKEEVARAAPLLVVLDTLRELHNGDENDSTTMKNVVTAVVEAIPDSAIMFISHSRKEFQSIGTDIMDDARGSGYIAGRMDAVMKMTAREMHVKSRGGALNIQIRQNADCGMIERTFTDASLIDFADYLMHVYRELPQREVAEIMAREADISEELARTKIRQWEEKRDKQFEKKEEDEV